MDEANDRLMEDSAAEHDVLVLAKTVAANDFPVERASVIGIDRESGRLLRLTPFPWKGADTDPPILRWAWIQVRTVAAAFDLRPGSAGVEGEVLQTAYVEAKDGWRLRWPFVRAHLHGSVESLQESVRAGAVSAGFVKPGPEWDLMQLPLRVRFRCASEECRGPHELPVLDWELHEMSRAARERHGAVWATKFRETWGRGLLEKYDVHVLVSSYAQSPSKLYVAGLFYPPREREDDHAHAHHAQHRAHLRDAPA
ncbi:MAG: hypothetical protein ACR2G8_09810 [Candidatus Limnocylindria bacterium]